MICDLTIQHVSLAEDAEFYRNFGYCPVECSFGQQSVIDDLRMDHHGELSDLEPVSIRAYRDYASDRALDPRFVVTGAADADATFAIAALAGFLPHPGLQIQQIGPNEIRLTRSAAWSVGDHPVAHILSIAETIASADLDPFARRWEETEAGLVLLAYKQRMKGDPEGAEAFRVGAELWRELIYTPPMGLVDAVKANELVRVERARSVVSKPIHPQIAFVQSNVWGWDVWYTEIAPIIVAYQADTGRCSIGCRSENLARQFFGLRGLLDVAEKLVPKGWGGRTAIIGSPRGCGISCEAALAAAYEVASSIAPR